MAMPVPRQDHSFLWEARNGSRNKSVNMEHYRYWAFISYSSKDKAFAKKLHQRLETYRIPKDLVGRPGRDGEPVPHRLMPIFRDREELPLSSDLGNSIEDALKACRYLIVICSRNAAQSRWVNEEIRYFKSIGREDRIMALIIDGEPGSSGAEQAENECFPPALRFRVGADGGLTDLPVEPIAGDLRPGGDGWTSAFLKAVAGITGMGYDAFARRERKRERRRRMMMGAAAALGIAASLFAWDHYRIKTAYFANIGLRWGIPEGVAALNQEQRTHRTSHFAIESSQGKVRTVRQLNAYGQLVEDEDNFDAAVHRVTYREDGSLQQVELRDRNDSLTLRKSYGEMRESAEGPVRFVEFQQEHQDAPFAMAALEGSRKTDITAHREVYQNDGRLASRTFMNVYRQIRSDAEGVFGERLHYEGESTLPARIENLNSAGSPASNRNGIVATTFVRTALGDVVDSRHFGSGEKPALGTAGWHREVTERDRYGNWTAWSLFDTGGKPVVSMSTFVHRNQVRRDQAGLIIESRHFGSDQLPVLDKDGVHRTTYRYDARGNTVEFRHFDTQDKPCLFANQGHRKTQVFDDRGNRVEWAIFGRDEEPILAGNGVHVARMEFNAKGKITEERYLGVNQEPVVSKDGYHRIVHEFDASGNRIGQAFFGPQDEPLLLKPHGVHRTVSRYDARGNRTAEIMFGADGQPCLSTEFGVHRIENAFDEQGNMLEQSYFGTMDEPILLKTGGYHRVRNRHDEKGNLVSIALFDIHNQPSLGMKSGFHSYQSEYDDLGRKIRQRFFGLKGEPVLRRDAGLHLVEITTDERGNDVSEQYYGTAGEPVLSFFQHAHRIDREFNDRSQMLSFATFGTDDKPVPGKDHSHRETYEWDERGNETDVRSYNPDGSPALNAEGYHHIARIYDDRRQLVELSYRGTKGERVLDNKLGFAIQRQAFDDLGRVTERSWLGTDGKPTLRKDSFIHRAAFRYDAFGYTTEEAYFDELNRPTLAGNRVHRIAHVNSPQGHRLEIRSYGTMREPVLHPAFGAHWIQYRYDTHGRQVELSLFGLEDEPVIGKNGNHYHRLVQAYDMHSRVIALEHFAPNDAPMLRDGGDQKYHRLENAYNERGQNIGWAHFGVNKEPVLRGGENWHRIELKLDLRGESVEASYFGVDNKPVLNRSGYHRAVFPRNLAGDVLSERFFGVTDEPVLFDGKYHERNFEYDLRGRMTGVRYLGLKGEPILSSGQTYHRVAYVHDERGNQIETRYFGLKDEPVATKDGNHRVMNTWDERGRRIDYAFFDTKEAPVLSFGFHRCVENYDERGREIGEAFFGIDGKPGLRLEGTIRYHRFTRAYDQRGNITEEVFFGPNNEPAYGWSDCHKHLRTYDVRGSLLSEVRLDLDGTEMSLLDLAGRWIEGFDQFKESERNDKMGHIMGALEKSAQNTVEPGTEAFSQLEALLQRVEAMLDGLDPKKDDVGRIVRGISTVRRHVAGKLLKLHEPDHSWEPWMAAAFTLPLEWEAVVPSHQQLELWQHIRSAAEAYCTWNNKRTTQEGAERLLAQLVKHQPKDPRVARLRTGAEWRITERLYDFHRAAGDLEAAGQTVRRLVTLTAEWVKLEPNVIEAHVNRAMALRKDAFLRWDIDKKAESLQPLKEGIEVLLAIRKRFPKDANTTVQIGFFHGNLAERQRALPSNEEAIANYTTAIKELTLGFELTKPEKPQFFADIGRYNDGIGELLLRKEDRLAAARWFKSGAEAWQRFAEAEPDHPVASLEQARQLFKMARTLEEAGTDLETAEKALKTADNIFTTQAGKAPLPGAFAGIPASITNLKKKLNTAQPKTGTGSGSLK